MSISKAVVGAMTGIATIGAFNSTQAQDVTVPESEDTVRTEVVAETTRDTVDAETMPLEEVSSFFLRQPDEPMVGGVGLSGGAVFNSPVQRV